MTIPLTISCLCLFNCYSNCLFLCRSQLNQVEMSVAACIKHCVCHSIFLQQNVLINEQYNTGSLYTFSHNHKSTEWCIQSLIIISFVCLQFIHFSFDCFEKIHWMSQPIQQFSLKSLPWYIQIELEPLYLILSQYHTWCFIQSECVIMSLCWL